eukprot:gene31892-94_t
MGADDDDGKAMPSQEEEAAHQLCSLNLTGVGKVYDMKHIMDLSVPSPNTLNKYDPNMQDRIVGLYEKRMEAVHMCLTKGTGNGGSERDVVRPLEYGGGNNSGNQGSNFEPSNKTALPFEVNPYMSNVHNSNITKWIGESVSDMINNKEKPFLLEKDDYKALVMDHPQIKDFSRVYDSDGSMFETYWVFTESTHGRPGGMKLTGGYNIFKKKLTDQLGRWSSDWTHYQAVTRAPVKMSARGKLDTASVQRAKDFCEHRLLNDNWRATADDPYGQVEFVAAVASVFGTTDNRTLEASVPPRLSVEQLAFISYMLNSKSSRILLFDLPFLHKI